MSEQYELFCNKSTFSLEFNSYIGCEFRDIEFQYLHFVEMRDCKFYNCSFARSYIKLSSLRSCTFKNCNFYYTQFVHSVVTATEGLEVFVYEVKDSRRKYFLLAWWDRFTKKFYYNAGCRCFPSYKEAVKHWGQNDYEDPYRGASYTYHIIQHERKHGELFGLSKTEIFQLLQEQKILEERKEVLNKALEITYF